MCYYSLHVRLRICDISIHWLHSYLVTVVSSSSSAVVVGTALYGNVSKLSTLASVVAELVICASRVAL